MLDMTMNQTGTVMDSIVVRHGMGRGWRRTAGVVVALSTDVIVDVVGYYT